MSKLTGWSMLGGVLAAAALLVPGCGGGGGGGGGGGQTSTVEGTVTEAVTGDPIQGATVSVVGTQLSDTTDAQGQYSIAQVPVGQRGVSASAAQYYAQTRYAEVSVDSTATVDIVLPPTSHSPTTYYVSPTGSDDTNDGSAAHPWATPGHGARQLLPGDTLVIAQGEYLIDEYGVDTVVPGFSGADGAWITIRGQDGAEPDLQGAQAILGVVEISGKSYIRLEHLTITSYIDNPYTGGARGGIEAGGSGGGPISNVVIDDVEIYDVEEAAINFAGNMDQVTIQNSHLHHSGGPLISAPSAQGGRGWENVLIDNCVLEYAGMFYQGQEQQSPWDRPDGVGMENSEGPLEIRYTTSQYNFGDGLDSKSKNTYIHHCLVANNYGDGVKLWGADSRLENTLIFGTGYVDQDETTPWCLLVVDSEDPGAHLEVTNCTMFDDQRRANAHYSMNAQAQYPEVPITLVMRNNIIAGLSRAGLAGQVTLQADHNLFYNRLDNDQVQVQIGDPPSETLYTDQTIGTLGTGNIYGDPLFVQAEWGPNGDFHLQNGSPAIDAGGTVASIVDDLVGTLRPQGPAYDIGAYER